LRKGLALKAQVLRDGKWLSVDATACGRAGRRSGLPPDGRARSAKSHSQKAVEQIGDFLILLAAAPSTPASSSIAERRETMALCFDSASAPSARVTDITAGNATGTEATSSTNMNCVICPAASQLQ